MENKMMHEQLNLLSSTPIISRNYDYDCFSFPWHAHEEFEIIFVKESTGERLVADSIERFKANDLVLIGHATPHCMKSDVDYHNNDEKKRVKGTIIQFQKDFLSFAINNYHDLFHIKALLDNSALGIHFPYPANIDLINHIEEISNLNGFKRIISLLQLLDKMATFEQKRFLGSSYFKKSFLTIKDTRTTKVLSYIMDHYKQDMDLKELSSLIAMNTSAFCRFFKEQTGKTVVEYILTLRIGHACNLLVESNLEILQICLDCGFNSTTHFNKIFKRNTGVTPSEYRKKFE